MNSKNLVISALILAACGDPDALAQTNVFPTSGNVGIGTTVPQGALDLGNATGGRALTWGGPSGTGRYASVFAPYSSGGLVLGVGFHGSTSVDSYLSSYGGNMARSGIRLNAWGANQGVLQFFTDSAATIAAGNSVTPTERMRIAADGKVGIGRTSSLYANFVVQNAGGSSIPSLGTGGGHFALENGTYGMLFGVSTSGRGWIQQQRTDTTATTYDLLLQPSGGNLGVGTASPTRTLDVIGQAVSSNEREVIRATASGHTTGIGIDAWGSHWGAAIFQDGLRRFIVEENGGALLGTGFMNYNAPANGLAVEGNVGIGTLTPSHKLAVNGTIRAKEVIVDTGWADYVFADDYDLAPLSEVEAHIEENGHLPDIPSANDVTDKGVSLGEMQSLLLAKIEELTLHQIRQEKVQNALQKQVSAQADQIRSLQNENQTLKGKYSL